MWRKSNFYEESSRIPMIVSWPAQLATGRRCTEVVSLVDLVATVIDLADAPAVAPLDGESLLPMLQPELATDGIAWKDEAFCEYLAHGVLRPMAMLRRGQFKLNYSLDDAVELYDLAADPGELNDLAADPAYAHVRESLREALLSEWNPVELEQRVRQSQAERQLIRTTEGINEPVQ